MCDTETTSHHRLKPQDTVQKFLSSTTSKLYGEYTNRQILITHAFPEFQDRATRMRTEETYMSRSAYVIAFETPPIEKKIGASLPDYSPEGEHITAYLSVLFGKRFDCHGLIEGSGFYRIPDLSSYDIPSDPRLPFNSHTPRSCFTVPLNLTAISTIDPVIVGTSSDPPDLSRLNAACDFYMQALQNAERNREVAYLHLITAGEILSGYFRHSRIRGVKRKLVQALCSLLDDHFYTEQDSNPMNIGFGPNTIEDNVGAAHDLRSFYVHTGVPFGWWVEPHDVIRRGDLSYGDPVVEDDQLRRVLGLAPTLLGLERLVRYCILRLMETRGLLVRDSTA